MTLKELRESNNKTLKEVALETKLCYSLISKIENGTSSISKKTAQILSDYYGVVIKPQKMIIDTDNAKIKEQQKQYKIQDLIKENKALKKENKKLKQKLNDINRNLIFLVQKTENLNVQEVIDNE